MCHNPCLAAACRATGAPYARRARRAALTRRLRSHGTLRSSNGGRVINVIALQGGPGGGKSTLAALLAGVGLNAGARTPTCRIAPSGRGESAVLVLDAAGLRQYMANGKWRAGGQKLLARLINGYVLPDDHKALELLAEQGPAHLQHKARPFPPLAAARDAVSRRRRASAAGARPRLFVALRRRGDAAGLAE